MTRHLLSQVHARENRKHTFTHKLVHTHSQQPKGETTRVSIRVDWVNKMQCVCVCVCVQTHAQKHGMCIMEHYSVKKRREALTLTENRMLSE